MWKACTCSTSMILFDLSTTASIKIKLMKTKSIRLARIVHFRNVCKHSSIFPFLLQLISSALNALVHGDAYGSVDGHISLTYRIAALHVVYHKNVSEILWFGQLVAFSPGIMDQLKEEAICDTDKMVYFQLLDRSCCNKIIV